MLSGCNCWDGIWDIGIFRFCQGSEYCRVYFILYLAHLACLQREVSGSGVLAGGWNVGTVENIEYWWTSPTRGTANPPFSRRADKKCRRQEMELGVGYKMASTFSQGSVNYAQTKFEV